MLKSFYLSVIFSFSAIVLLLFVAGCGGDDPSGCPSGQTSCDGVCTDTEFSPDHCGACGNVCVYGEICQDGACSSICSGSTPTKCGDSCVDTDSSRDHCGGCDNSCSDGEFCIDGECGISCGGSTSTLCGDACVNTDTDEKHCGGCDHACESGEFCSDGECGITCGGSTPTLCGDACVDTDINSAHCGECDQACASGEFCSDGECGITCGGSTPTLCGNACVDTEINPAHCGDCDQACGDGAVCSDGECLFECAGSTPTLCDDECVNTDTDQEHCGACDQNCDDGELCSDGECGITCGGSTPTLCGDACVNTDSDEAHCGDCDQPCGDGEVCSEGECGITCGGSTPTLCGDSCINTDTDEAHCGDCDQVCGDGEVCSDGECEISCGGSTPTLCGDSCVNTDTDEAHCGDCDQVCGDGEVCSDGECEISCGGSTPTICGDSCVNTDTNEAHCGGCDSPCDVGEYCQEGECSQECVPSAEVCDGEDNDCDEEIDEDAVDAITWTVDEDEDEFGAVGSDDIIISCNQPDGYVENNLDCNDSDSDIFPDADELCNNEDDDCDGETDEDAVDADTWYLDNDEDGFGDPDESMNACEQPEGYISDDSDCDDSDPGINPDAGEVCNNGDDDCDGEVDEDAVDAFTWYLDNDEDGYGDPDESLDACEQPEGYLSDTSDCDDSDSGIFPGADEVCNEADDDCDDEIDEDAVDADTWYFDNDTDGYGDPEESMDACNQPDGYVDNSDDCVDDNSTVNPDAEDLCNFIDDDCNGEIDDGSDHITWYLDEDSDTFGNPEVTEAACNQPNGYVLDNTDCDDSSITVHPYAWEVMDNEIDDDCDGDIDGGDGTIVNTLDLGDDAIADIVFGEFIFPFCGEDQTNMRITSNGRMLFVEDSVDWSESVGELLSDGPVVSAHWDDMTPNIRGSVAWIEYNDAVGIYFRGVPEYGSSFDNTYSVIFLADGTFIIQWEELGTNDLHGITGWSCGVNEGSAIDINEYPVISGAAGIGSGTEFGLYEDFGTVDLSNMVRRFTATAGTDLDGDGWTEVGGDPDDEDEQNNPYDLDNDGELHDFWGSDCDDLDPTVYTGAEEACNDADDNCNGQIDEGFLWFFDNDEDGFGNALESAAFCDGEPEEGMINDSSDCNDDNDAIAPRMEDVYGDGEDTDCDGTDAQATWFDDSTYFVMLPINNLTWSQANDNCIDVGYDGLASVLSEDEQTFFETMRRDSDLNAGAWFGYTDAEEDGIWVWSDGSESDYTNWGDQEPNGEANENCGEFTGSGGWNDLSCDTTRALSLCQWRH